MPRPQLRPPARSKEVSERKKIPFVFLALSVLRVWRQKICEPNLPLTRGKLQETSRKLACLGYFFDGALVVGDFLDGDLQLGHLSTNPANGLH